MAIKASQHGAAPLRERLANDSGGPAFIKVAKDGDYAEASSKALSAYQLIESTIARDRFKNMDTDTSVREGYSRTDYEYFRTGEHVPCKYREVMAACNNAYRHTGI
ncbi:unnamed protein product, partial [marine sediment metagenome]